MSGVTGEDADGASLSSAYKRARERRDMHLAAAARDQVALGLIAHYAGIEPEAVDATSIDLVLALMPPTHSLIPRADLAEIMRRLDRIERRLTSSQGGVASPVRRMRDVPVEVLEDYLQAEDVAERNLASLGEPSQGSPLEDRVADLLVRAGRPLAFDQIFDVFAAHLGSVSGHPRMHLKRLLGRNGDWVEVGDGLWAAPGVCGPADAILEEEEIETGESA